MTSLSATPQPAEKSSECLTSFFKLLVPVTALHFVGDFRNAREIHAEINRPNEADTANDQNHISHFARYLRGGDDPLASRAMIVQKFNEAITHNLDPYPENDWLTMSDLCRRYVLIQRIFEEGCAQSIAVASTRNGIPLEDFTEVLNALLIGASENRKAFDLSMMHQLSHRSTDLPHRSGLGKAFAYSPEARALLKEKVLLPLSRFIPHPARALLQIS